MIQNSLDWPPIEVTLLRKASSLVHGADVKKMIGNIQHQVTELSRAEVLVRQGQKHRADALLIRINNDIELVEEYLLVAALLG
jgi:hypothetical protein